MIDENVLLSLEDGNILFPYNLNENIFKTQNLINFPQISVFQKPLLQATVPNGAFNSANITSHLYCQSQQVHEVQRGGRTCGTAGASWKHV